MISDRENFYGESNKPIKTRKLEFSQKLYESRNKSNRSKINSKNDDYVLLRIVKKKKILADRSIKTTPSPSRKKNIHSKQNRTTYTSPLSAEKTNVALLAFRPEPKRLCDGR